jgi:hypothetical protein
MFAAAPTPESLERSADVQLRIGGAALMDLVPSLDSALARTECRANTTLHEARTGIIFYADGKKLASFYYGPGGRGGQVDGRDCDLSPSLYYWARRQLPETD